MSFGSFSKKYGVPWNGRPAPVQKYRYFPALIKKAIAFLSSGASYATGWTGWTRRHPKGSREAKRRALISILKTNARGVSGVRPPEHVFLLAAHRARMETRMTARQDTYFRRRKTKARGGARSMVGW